MKGSCLEWLLWQGPPQYMCAPMRRGLVIQCQLRTTHSQNQQAGPQRATPMLFTSSSTTKCHHKTCGGNSSSNTLLYTRHMLDWKTSLLDRLRVAKKGCGSMQQSKATPTHATQLHSKEPHIAAPHAPAWVQCLQHSETSTVACAAIGKPKRQPATCEAQATVDTYCFLVECE